jgi:hypothetical protein
MNIFILLTIMLIGGFVFLLVQVRQPKSKNIPLRIAKLPTKDIKAIILFVPTLRKDEPLESLLAYKALSHLARDNTSTKYVWLIHGDLLSEEGASYYNTQQIVRRFKSDRIRIEPHSMSIAARCLPPVVA